MADASPKQSTESRDLGAASTRRSLLASLGAMGAALVASLCCIGPVLFVTFGVGAGLASRFEPLRPVFALISVGLLAIGFYTVYGGKRPLAHGASTASECALDGACGVPRHRTRDKVLLWIGTAVALLLLTFPQWSKLLV